MKCLLVSYTGLGVNSTEHAAAFGCGLTRLGWSVRLAVRTKSPYRGGFDFFSCSADGSLHPLDRAHQLEPADVVHVWTPRAPIWRFLETHHRLVGGALVLHLEDDETEVLRLFGADSARPDAVSRAQLRAMQLEDWTHPVLARCLAFAADGVTILSPELANDVPKRTPWLHVFPPLPPNWWDAIPEQPLPGHANGKHTVVYAGGLHSAMADDFFELCRAVDLLGRRGHPVRLVRCGPEVSSELLSIGARLAGEFRDLGHLPVDALRALLNEASVLVQPGGPTKFNRRRMPAKLAPYLASGRPVVMPSNYSWLGVRDREHAVMFEEGSAAEIAEAIDAVLRAPDDAREMAARAAAFSRERFDLERCCAPLAEFYRSLPSRPRFPWRSMRQPRLELPLLVAQSGLQSDPDLLASPPALVHLTLEEIRAPVQRDGPKTVAQLFWPVRRGYLEHFSSVRPMHSGRWNRLSFGPRLLQAHQPPRFDPGDRPGILEITAIDYRGGDGRLLHRFRPPDTSQPQVNPHGTTIPLPPVQRQVWRWLSTGNDPQLLLPTVDTEHMIRIDCWMRWTPTE